MNPITKTKQLDSTADDVIPRLCKTSELKSDDLDRLIRHVKKAIDTPLPVPMRKDDDPLINTANMAGELLVGLDNLTRLSRDFACNVDSLSNDSLDRLVRNRAWDEPDTAIEDAQSIVNNELHAIAMYDDRLYSYCDRFRVYVDSFRLNIRLMPEPYPGQEGDDEMYFPMELLCRSWMPKKGIQVNNFSGNEPCSDFGRFVCDIIECCVKGYRKYSDGYKLPHDGIKRANIYSLRKKYARTLKRIYTLQPDYFNGNEGIRNRKQQEAAAREEQQRLTADNFASIVFEAVGDRDNEVRALMKETTRQLLLDALFRKFDPESGC